MDNKVLLTHGDSFTWGYQPNNGDPLENPFPKLLAQKLNFDLVNCALYSLSNQTICRELLHFLPKYKDNVFLVVGWTNVNRNEWFSEETKEWNSLVTQDKRIVWEMKSFLHDLYETLKCIKLIQYYCESNNIPYLFFNTFPNDFKVKDETLIIKKQPYTKNSTFEYGSIISRTIFENYEEYKNYNLDSFVDLIDTKYFCDEIFWDYVLKDEQKYTFMPNDGHPNESGHSIWADYLFNKINRLEMLDG
tara:strand:+ start:4541 stop:5281 length:741 start_codon:yes stop_codon:yes gene_type:complete